MLAACAHINKTNPTTTNTFFCVIDQTIKHFALLAAAYHFWLKRNWFYLIYFCIIFFRLNIFATNGGCFSKFCWFCDNLGWISLIFRRLVQFLFFRYFRRFLVNFCIFCWLLSFSISFRCFSVFLIIFRWFLLFYFSFRCFSRSLSLN